MTIEDVAAIRNAAAGLLDSGTKLYGTRERQSACSSLAPRERIDAARSGLVGGNEKVRECALAAADVADRLEAELTVVS